MPGLFDPMTIKGLTLKNRVVMPPMGTNLATPEGEVTDKHLARYVPIARAGVGLIIVEHTYVSWKGRYRATQLGVWHDKLVPGRVVWWTRYTPPVCRFPCNSTTPGPKPFQR